MAPLKLSAQNVPAGDAARGKAFFQINCAVCHSPVLGTDNTVIMKQGPSLVGVVGRPAGSLPHFNYTKAIRESGFTWDPATLNRFLANPMVVVPGTTMPIPVVDPRQSRRCDRLSGDAEIPGRRDPKIRGIAGNSRRNRPERLAAPGARERNIISRWPSCRNPTRPKSAGNGPQVVPAPTNATLAVPPGFTVKLFAKGLHNPRLVRTAPNGDIFIAETGRNRIRVMRTADGADAPTENQIFAEGLRRSVRDFVLSAGRQPAVDLRGQQQFGGAISLSQRRFEGQRRAGGDCAEAGGFHRRPLHAGCGVFQGRQADVHFGGLRLERGRANGQKDA